MTQPGAASATDPPVLAEVWRGAVCESVHRGYAVLVDRDGQVRQAWGDPVVTVLPRSAAKPMQAAGLVRAGLRLPAHLLALAAASHSGEPGHVRGVRAILAGAGLHPADLRCPPQHPYDPDVRDGRVAHRLPPSRLTMNCSGKHAAMLATCVLRGWPTTDYLDPGHPLQQLLRAEVAELAGPPVGPVLVDGCGAPLVPVSLVGLARAASTCVTAASGTPPRVVADAMRAHPEQVGGTGRDVTVLMRAIPGLLVKDGAEAVCVAALPDGRGLALKVLDGAERARPVVLAALLRRLGVSVPELRGYDRAPVFGGEGVVGAVRPAAALLDPA